MSHHPEIEVDIHDAEARPLAAIALVRRELQRAGHDDDARAFSMAALGASPGEIQSIAAAFVTVAKVVSTREG